MLSFVEATYRAEDSSLLEAIKHAASAGLADVDRVAILHTGSDLDRPPPGAASPKRTVC